MGTEWHSEHHPGIRQRHELEKEYAQCRKEWARQKLTVVETTETNETKKNTLEAELKYLTDTYVESKRVQVAKESELQGRINALEDVMKTSTAHLEDTSASLADSKEQIAIIHHKEFHSWPDFPAFKIFVLDRVFRYVLWGEICRCRQIARTKSEASAQLQVSMEQCCQLERDLEQKRREWEDERNRLEICLENERRDATESRDKYEKWREHHSLALKQVSEENNAKIRALEEAKSTKEEEFHKEEQAAQIQLQQNNAKIEQCKQEANRLRTCLDKHHNRPGFNFDLGFLPSFDLCFCLSTDRDFLKYGECRVRSPHRDSGLEQSVHPIAPWRRARRARDQLPTEP